jgi:hypothetical protein
MLDPKSIGMRSQHQPISDKAEPLHTFDSCNTARLAIAAARETIAIANGSSNGFLTRDIAKQLKALDGKPCTFTASKKSCVTIPWQARRARCQLMLHIQGNPTSCCRLDDQERGEAKRHRGPDSLVMIGAQPHVKFQDELEGVTVGLPLALGLTKRKYQLTSRNTRVILRWDYSLRHHTT